MEIVYLIDNHHESFGVAELCLPACSGGVNGAIQEVTLARVSYDKISHTHAFVDLTIPRPYQLPSTSRAVSQECNKFLKSLIACQMEWKRSCCPNLIKNELKPRPSNVDGNMGPKSSCY